MGLAAALFVLGFIVGYGAAVVTKALTSKKRNL